MSIRLDPRRLAALKLLASESGIRPGELVTRWIEEQIDAARAGETAPSAASEAALAEVRARLDALARRVETLESGQAAKPAAEPAAPSAPSAAPADEKATAARRRGRRPARGTTARAGAGSRIALHDEISAIITERGPLTAAELAAAVVERGRYAPPRSARPIDASVINSRVSNPVYRARFVRREGRIGLAEGR